MIDETQKKGCTAEFLGNKNPLSSSTKRKLRSAVHTSIERRGYKFLTGNASILKDKGLSVLIKEAAHRNTIP